MSGLQVTTSGATDLVLTRTFAAAASPVFAALTQPDLLRRWYGARGWQLRVCEIDLRVGGAWRYVSRGPDGAEMEQYGLFNEIVPAERLVQTEVHRDWTDGDALVTTVLAETHDGTAMTVTVRYSTSEIRDQVLRGPMQSGAGEGYDRLAALLVTEEKETTHD